MKYSFKLGDSSLVLLLALAIFVVVIGFVVLRKAIPPTSQPPLVQDELRGGRVLILRLPQSIEPPQEIQIFEDGVAGRVHIVSGPNTVAQKVQLSKTERAQITTLRTQWCQALPTFRPLQRDDMYYELGVQCTYDQRHIKIPLDQLPGTLDTLLKRI